MTPVTPCKWFSLTLNLQLCLLSCTSLSLTTLFNFLHFTPTTLFTFLHFTLTSLLTRSQTLAVFSSFTILSPLFIEELKQSLKRLRPCSSCICTIRFIIMCIKKTGLILFKNRYSCNLVDFYMWISHIGLLTSRIRIHNIAFFLLSITYLLTYFQHLCFVEFYTFLNTWII